METASMFTVAPSGMAILVILSDTPISSSMRCLLMGMVAELEQVPKAFSAAGRQAGLDKADGAFLAQEPDRTAVHHSGKTEEGNVQDHQLGCQREDGVGAVGLHHRNDGAEHTHRREVHHGADDLQADFVACLDDFQQRFALFVNGDESETDDDRKGEHLQHIAVGKGRHRVRGDEVFEGVQNAGHLAGLNVRSGHLEPDTLTQMDGAGNDQTHKTGKRRGAQEKDHGTAGDLAGGFGIADAGDAHHDGAEHQREDHHVQGIHVDAAQQLGHGEHRREAPCQKQAGEDAEHQTRKNCAGDVLLITRKKVLWGCCAVL